jgi:hypothetical protein
MVPMMYLSGFIFPIDNMPEPIQWLTTLVPLRYFLVIVRGIFLKGVGFDVLWPQFAALGSWGVTMLALAAFRSHKRASGLVFRDTSPGRVDRAGPRRICPMKIHVGTSGYNYNEWRGTFYPDDLPTKEMFRFYSNAFRTVEINYRAGARGIHLHAQGASTHHAHAEAQGCG